MLHHYVAVSLLLCLLTTSTSGQQNIKGEQLAFWSDLGSRFSTKSLIGSESVTMAALNGAALSGYGFFATYLDDSCATFESSIIYPLNTCFFLFSEGVGYFTKLSASSTEYIQENYSDNTCKTLTSTGDSTAYTTECNSKGKIFVQSSINAPTTKSTISYSFHEESDTTCSASAVETNVFITGTCIQFTANEYGIINVSGSTITTDTYDNAQCTGSSRNSVSAKSGSCVSDGGKYRRKTTAPTSGITPVSSPVGAPVSSPVSTPVRAPVGAPTPVSSPVFAPTTVAAPAPISSPTAGALSGYAFFADYLDESCTTFGSAEIVPLNSCITYIDDEVVYYKYICTSTTRRFERYSEDTCKTVVEESSPTTYSTACSGRSKFFVDPSSQPPTSKPFVTFGYYSERDTTCSASNFARNVVALNECVQLKGAYTKNTISGSTIVTDVYSNAECSGSPARTLKNSNGPCSSIDGKYRQQTSTSSAEKFSASSTLKACFAGSETVTLESGNTKPISEVRAGDRVLAADASMQTLFSEVVFVPHGSNAQKTVFTHITTAHGRDIKMTGSHIMPAGACGSTAPLPNVYASAVAVGDCIMTVSGMEMVSAVETVQGEGLYTIVTKDEYVVVNGIIASPFAFNHMAANLYYNIHRFVYACVPGVLTMPMVRSANEVQSPLL